jgi:hypothetical protein
MSSGFFYAHPRAVYESIGSSRIMHRCPVCGKPTEGIYLEDGVKYDLCEVGLLKTIEDERFDADWRRDGSQPFKK